MYQKLQKPLSNVNLSGGGTVLLYTGLHHLILLLSATTPRSETIGIRIISVLSTLRQVGGRIRGWQLRLLNTIVREQNIHPQNLEHLQDLVFDTFVDPTLSNLNTCEAASSLLFDVPPQDLSDINFSQEFQSPTIVAPIPSTFPQKHERAMLLNVIGETQSFDKAWDAYRKFPSQPLAEDSTLNAYPRRHLHRLVSLLATIKPRTRKVYLSLVSIMSTLRASGHLIYTWEWNFLVDASAKGWRKTRFEDYKSSLRVFNDMLAYQREVRESDRLPHINPHVLAGSHGKEPIPDHDSLAPDIYSYTTLISHAARTLSPKALEHARSLLNSSGIIPNLVTLLAQLRLHTYHNQIYGIRRTISEIRDRGFTLDSYGVNSIMWAFARNEHMEVVESIYRVLRNNIGYDGGVFGEVDEDIAATVKFLDEVENIVIPPTLVPDRITYTILIQSFTYKGDFTRSVQVFADMLSSPDPFATWRGAVGVEARFQPIMQIFRAIFLGFYHHGVGPTGPTPRPRSALGPQGNHEQRLEWSLQNLDSMYKEFLEFPSDRKPTDVVVYWLIMAFEKCSGGDYWKMREVWTALESKWGDRWGPRLRRVREKIHYNTEHTGVTGAQDGL